MFTRILVPVDLAHKEQLPRLVAAASLLVNITQGEICLLYVDPILIHKAGSLQLDKSLYRTHEKQALAQLKALVEEQELAQTPALASVALTYRTCEGSAHEKILEEAEQRNADAIVMMSKRPGLASYFIGSTAERVVRHASCSVFVIRNND
ncbi:MAG: universal stress protein F [Motiliproteus sp.]|jgi:universal stress protein F